MYFNKDILFEHDIDNHKITYYPRFNDDIPILPDDIHTIVFSDNGANLGLFFSCFFNRNIKKNVLPKNLHIFTLSSQFNKNIEIDVLPIFLHTLNFGDFYNQNINVNILPKYLHTLTFGDAYNRDIQVNVLPKYLHTLTFGKLFNQSISKNVIPQMLYSLNLKVLHNNRIIMPQSLKHIGLNAHLSIIDNLPSNITSISIYPDENHNVNEIMNLPNSLEKIFVLDKKLLKYITKIPYDCKIIISDNL